MKRTLIILAVLACCGSLSVPVAAAEKGWQIRVYAAGFDPSLDVMVPAGNPEEVRVTADRDLGFGASLEYQFNNLLGLEVGYMQASPTVELSADVPGMGHLSLTDSLSTRVISLDLDIHLTPSSQSFDFYLGAGIASMGYGNLHYVDPEGDPLDLVVSNDLGVSAKAGVGIALGRESRWSAIGSLRYIWTNLEARQAQDQNGDSATFDFDTFSFSVGLGYRF